MVVFVLETTFQFPNEEICVKIKKFVTTSVMGGLLVVLPVAISFMVFNWLFVKTTEIIQPLTSFVVKILYLPEITADVLVLITLCAICFFLGVFVKTSFGKFMHKVVEEKILKKIPIYSIVREVITQFLGNKKSPFSSVALAKLFGNDTLVTVFVVDECENGLWTVFMPTGPNPTSGNIYHLPKENVFKIEVPVEKAMRTILSCGAGSADLLQVYNK